MPLTISNDQKDEHCQMVFKGRQCWIIGKRGPLFVLASAEGRFAAKFPCEGWPDYSAAASTALRKAFPASFT